MTEGGNVCMAHSQVVSVPGEQAVFNPGDTMTKSAIADISTV